MDTLQQMWATRPPRIPEDQGGKAVFAGVCEGIGARYNVDPTMVRLGFVGLSLIMGCGLPLYLLCWITMPRFGMTTTPWQSAATPKAQLPEAARKEKSTGIALAAALGFMAMTFVSDLGSASGTLQLAGVTAGALSWYGLHQRVPEPPAGLLATAPDAPGPAPDLWHLPEPTEPAAPSPAPRRNRPLWLWVPVALIASAAAVAVIFAADSLRFYSFHGPLGGVGDLNVAVDHPDMLPPVHHVAGTVTVDLSSVEPLDAPAAVEVGNYAGRIEVLLPEGVPVTVSCAVGIGASACPAPQEGDGAQLTVDARQFIGSVSARPAARE